jgi:hypothetical protein
VNCLQVPAANRNIASQSRRSSCDNYDYNDGTRSAVGVGFTDVQQRRFTPPNAVLITVAENENDGEADDDGELVQLRRQLSDRLPMPQPISGLSASPRSSGGRPRLSAISKTPEVLTPNVDRMEEVQSAAIAGSLYDAPLPAKRNSPPTARTVCEVGGRRASSPTAAARSAQRIVNGVATPPSITDSPPTNARVGGSKETPSCGEPLIHGSTANRRLVAANGRGFESADQANSGEFEDVKRRRNDEVYLFIYLKNRMIKAIDMIR